MKQKRPRSTPAAARSALAPEPTISEIFAAALQNHQAGRLDEAAQRYSQSLAQDARHADSLHLLGVIAYQRGNPAQAVEYIQTALAINGQAAAYHYNLANAWEALAQRDAAVASFQNALLLQPNYPEAHYNLGNTLRTQEKLEGAVAAFREALHYKPDHAKALNNLGAVLAEQGKLEEAVACYRRALGLQPDFAEAHNNLGAAYREQGRLDEAVICYRRALDLEPEAVETANRLGNVLLDQGQADQAAAYYRRSIAARPDLPEAHNNLGAALEEQGQLEAAVECYYKSLALKPDFAKAHYNLGIARAKQGRTEDAAEDFRKALSLQPGYREAYNNLGCVFLEQGKLEAAIDALRRAVALDPDIAESHHNLSLALLTAGDMVQGWVEHEWRWGTAQMRADRRRFTQPQWRGERAAGKTLLIHAEQGFGDTLQFCRYASLAAAHGLRVCIEVPQPLVRLLRTLSGIAHIIACGDTLPPFDLHCPMLSLPLAFGTTLANIPAAAAYLSADAAAADAWRRRLSALTGGAWRIGLAWAGNPRLHLPAVSAIDRRRSMPVADLAPLWSTSNCQFFSLQKDPPAPSDLPLTDFMSEMQDFADTAALIANLDLVISVDTAVAHLAAALGKPVWLLDRFDACWRWLRDRRDSPWYPSLLIYRQPAAGDWGRVVDAIRQDLTSLSSGANIRSTLELAVKHHQAGRFDQATVLYRQVLAQQPRHADSLHLLGVIADQKGQHDLAIGTIREAIAINPNEAVYHYNLGIALTEHGQPDEAVACYRQAISLKPDYSEAHNNLGLALRGLGRLDEAIAHHRRAIELRPQDAKAHNNLGIALRERGQLDDAVASYRTSLTLQPDYPDALNNLGIGLKDQGQLGEAIVCCRQAVALRPDFAESHYNLGTTLLTAGELPEGWREFEWRWKTAQLLGAERRFTQPQWYGQEAQGKTLLIHSEQGYGDALQFCRYATLAAARGLYIFLEVQAPLVRVMKTVVGVEQVFATGEALPAFDLHCPMMSLPLAFGTDLASIPSAQEYLYPAAKQVGAWRQRLAATGYTGRRIGLVWAGNPRLTMPAAAAVDRRRSMPPEYLAPLFSLPDTQFFSLQKEVSASFPLIDLMAEMHDFADTAALIANLDLVISVDTAVAHLAAAIGKPVWLLDRSDACWRWLRGRRDSPWYPSLRIYRQPVAGDWGSVVADVLRDLKGTPNVEPEGPTPAITVTKPHVRQQTLSASPEELYHLGISHGKQVENEQAAACYRRAIAQRPDFPEAHHNLGVALLSLGLPDEAIACYRTALSIRDDFPEAHSNLGTALLHCGQTGAAIACFRAALVLRRDFAEAYNNLGAALRQEGEWDEALANFRNALAIKPDFLEAQNNIGATLRQLGRHEDAVVLYRFFLQTHPDNADLHCGLGIALAKLERYAEAIECYRQALALRPEFADAHQNLATALRQLGPGTLDEAIAHYREAIANREAFPEAHTNLGTALWERGETDAAIICHRRALALKPEFADAYNNLGAALLEQGYLDEAVSCYERALELNPDFQQVYNNLGLVFRQQGKWQQGLACHRHARELNPDDPDTRVNLGMALLADGDFSAGWQEYEWRLKKPQRITSVRPFAQPQWHGEAAEGRRLLIHPEQGYGDTLQFCRFAAVASARGFHVSLEVQRPLVRLLQSLQGVAKVLGRGDELPEFDVHCPIMSLPFALGTTLETIPTAPAYLHADPQQVAAWRRRLAVMEATRDHRTARIGLVWAGNPRLNSPRATAVDRRRSMPPDRLAPLFEIKELEFFSLQKDGPAAGEVPIIDLMGQMDDFADTAALIANLDLVIAVDTAVAHLAASLGKPVWLLERFDSCWRWLRGRRDTPWYPSMRLYRQPKSGDWESVMSEVAHDLKRQAWQPQRGRLSRRLTTPSFDAAAEAAIA